MRRLSLVLTFGFVAYTVAAVIYYNTFPYVGIVTVGHNQLRPFDLLFYPALVLFAIGLLWHRTAAPSARTRLFGWIIAAYIGYEVLVVLPVAVIWKGYSLPGAIYALTPRLSMFLVLFFALLVTRYWSGHIVLRLVEWAAIALLVVAVWRFAHGTPATVETGGRLRFLWGGSTLLFGWLAASRLLGEKLRIRDLAMGMAGLGGIVLVNHRSAYVALVVAAFAYLLARRRHVARTVGVFVGAALLGAVLVFALVPTVAVGVRYTFSTLLNPSADRNTTDRVVRSELGFEEFAANPFGDIIWRGNGSYYLVNVGAADFAPHDFVVQLLDEEGLVGFLAWLVLLTLALYVAFRNARRDNDSAVLGSYVVFYLVFCLFNANFYLSQSFVLLAAAIGLIMWRDRVVATLEFEPFEQTATKGVEVLRAQPNKSVAAFVDTHGELNHHRNEGFSRR